MSDIRITGVRAIATAPQGIALVVVRVDTNQPGLYGLGCATYTQRWPLVVQAVDQYMAPLMIGRDALAIEDNWQVAHGSPYWRNGPVLNNAISGVDMALWDILGKVCRQPVYQLLGGKVRTGVPVYRHAGSRDLDGLLKQVQAYRDRGVEYIRCQLGAYGGEINYLSSPEGSRPGAYFDARAYMRSVPKMFREVRAAFGDELELLHDVHERLAPIDAMRIARELEEFNLFFLEDLLPPEQVDWFREIRQACTTPLAMGELFNNPMEWNALVRERLIDFMRVHISQIGGLTPARKLAIQCEAYGIRTAWHGPGDVSPIGHACNIHLDLVSHNFGIQEWNGIDESEQIREVFDGVPEMRGAFVYANDRPGWGITMDEEKAAKYPCSAALPQWTLTRLPDGTPVRP